MISLAEIVYAIQGSLRLARFDRSGLDWFEFSERGFWRSFWAAVLSWPMFAIYVRANWARAHALDATDIGFGTALLGQSLSYALAWALFPVVVMPLVKLFGLSARYVPYIVVRNWTSLVQTTVVTIAVAIGTLVPPAAADMLLMWVLIAVIVYEWFITRASLDTTGLNAAGFVFFSLIFSLILGRVATVIA